MKRRTTVYIDNKLWQEFMKYIIDKHGKKHGGIISEEVSAASKTSFRERIKI